MTTSDLLTRITDLGPGRIDDGLVSRASQLMERAAQRGEVGFDTTVVALLGATGSGKSSLVNALVGAEVARVHARRPTTSVAHGISATDHGQLLDLLGVPNRDIVPTAFSGRGDLLLLDLPDIDSTEAAHREIVEAIAPGVDILIWVLDPQKYADSVVHDDFLAALGEHADVTLVVLNQIDRVQAAERVSVMRDASGLVGRHGLDSQVLATSALSGEGIDELRTTIIDIASQAEVARVRLAADARDLGTHISASLGEKAPGIGKDEKKKLASMIVSASGADRVADAAAASYLRQGRRRTGIPGLRRVRTLKIDPLARLGLRQDRSEHAVTGVRASAARHEQVRAGVRDIVQNATVGMPRGRRLDLVDEAESRVDTVLDRADRDIAGADLNVRPPTWWSLVNVLQWLAVLTALVGAGWLGFHLVATSYLQINSELPMIGALPLPTVFLGAGVVSSFLLSVLSGFALRTGARRRAGRVRKMLRTAIEPRADMIADPITSDIEVYNELRSVAARLARTKRYEA